MPPAFIGQLDMHPRGLSSTALLESIAGDLLFECFGYFPLIQASLADIVYITVQR
jgi:hypothetical protein